MNVSSVSDSTSQGEIPGHLEMAGKFILSLIQALLRTGYYLPDHPESRKAKSGIYNYFSVLTQRSREISLYIGEDKGKRAILVEGIAETPIKLASVMQLGMAETYMPRIIQYLERRELVCLSMKAELDENEFCQLIDVLSEPPPHDLDGTAAQALFIRSLAERGIHNISFVFREDIIRMRANLPWRVRMALSRLRKDLHLIPILRNLEEDELHQVKMQVLTDILRPLSVPELAYSFLLHLDLAATGVVSEEDAEQRFFRLITGELLLSVARLFIHDSVVANGFPEHVSDAKINRLQADFCRRLGASSDPRAAALLEDFFDNGLISFEDLPERLQKRIETTKRLGVFLKDPEKFLASFESITDPVMYESRARILASFVQILIERELVGEAVGIIEIIMKHAGEQSARAPLAATCRAECASDGILRLASGNFLSGSKETRTLIGRLFTLIGAAAIPHMQALLINSDDPWKSKQAAEILISMGEHAIAGLLASVEDNRIKPSSLSAVLRVISEGTLAGQKESAVNLLVKLVNDSRTDIRSEALAGLGRIGAAGNFTLFRAKADDPVIQIRKVAVSGIGRSGDRRGGPFLTALIEKAEKSGGGDDQELAAAAIEALGSLMVSCPAVYDAGLACLSALAERYCPRSSWNKLLSGSFVQPECMVSSLTEALGKLRGEAVQNLLAKLSKHHYPSVAKRATLLLNTLRST